MARTTPTPHPSTLPETDPTHRRFRGSAKISDYETTKEKLGEGTFGIVSKARSKRTGHMFALKKILMHNEKEGFPITALREVKLLKMLRHPNVLRLEEMAVERVVGDEKGKSGKKRATLYMVTPYMEHDLSGMLTNPDIRFSEPQIKCYMQQLLEGLRYLHDSHILHRDMKAANILISNRGGLQIADFGLARHYDGPTPQAGLGNGEAVRDYTSLVVTRWYRPPELLLTLKRYTPAIDLWGVGCVFAEMFERKPILEGKTDIDQCTRVFALVGSPNDTNMPGWSELPGCEGQRDWEVQKGDIDKRFGPRLGPQGLDLLKQLLCLDWRKRVNAVDALQHAYFTTQPLPADPEALPRYEDSHELDSRRRGHEKQRALPPAPAGGTVGMGADEWNGSGRDGYGYADRGPRGYGRERERGPPGRNYDDRGRPPLHDVRQPGWRQDLSRGPQPSAPTSQPNGHGVPVRAHDLPPRPELPSRAPSSQPATSNLNGGRNAPPADTYIPTYNDRAPRERERERETYDRDRGGRREDTYRDPDRPSYRDSDGPPRERDRGRYRDVDAPPPPRDSRPGERGDGYRDRDFERERERHRRDDRDRERRAHSRSRSPGREDSRRERPRDTGRDREGYRR